MNPYIGASKNLLYFSLLPSCPVFFISFIIPRKCEEIYIPRKVVLFFEMGLSSD